MMRKLVLILLAAFMLVSPLPVFAGGDEIEMKDGSVLKGDIVARNAEQIYLSTKDKGVIRVDASEIHEIHFGPSLRTSGKSKTA